MTGLKEAIAAKERVIEPKHYLSEDAIAEINDKLLALSKGQIITVVYYGDYEQRYLQVTGPVAKVDSYWHSIQIEGITIDFAEIYALMSC